MKIHAERFQKVAEDAKAKTTNKRWIAAIDKAADALVNGKWIVTELRNCLAVTTESGKTYFANGHCQCEAFFRDQPCKHRAAARLIEKYNEEVATPATSRAGLIAEIESIWPRFAPGVSLYTELLARFGKSNLNMLDNDSLRRVRLAVAI